MFKKFFYLFTAIFFSFISQQIFSDPLVQVPTVHYDEKHELVGSSDESSDTTLIPILTIKHDSMKQQGALLPEQVLRHAGLIVRDLSGDGTQPVISMNGFGDNAAQNTLLLINGEPMNNPDLGAFNFNQLIIDTLNNIQIYSGSQGVLFGNSAVAGAVDFNTLPLDKNLFSLDQWIGSYHTTNTQFYLNRVRANHWIYRLQSNYRATDNYRENNSLQNPHANIAIEKLFNSGQVTIQTDVNQQNLQYPGALTTQQVQQNRRQAERPNDSDHDNETNDWTQLHWVQDVSDNVQMQINSMATVMNANGVLTQAYTRSRYNFNFDPFFTINTPIFHKTSIVTIGAQARNSNYTFDGLTYFSSATQNIGGVYLIDKTNLSEKWQMVLGVRGAAAYDDQRAAVSQFSNVVDKTYNAGVTTVEMNWHVTPVAALFARRAGSFRFPTTDENINTNTGQPLNTQTGADYESGLHWQALQHNGEISLFYLGLNNEITAIPIPNSQTTYAQNMNLAPTYRYGVSLHEQWQWAHDIVLEGTYHYVNPHFSAGPDNGNLIPFVAKNSWTFSMTKSFNDCLLVGIEDQFTGARSFANDPEQRSPLVPSYNIVNVNLRYYWKHMIADLRLNNITNTQYNAYSFDIYNGNATSSYFYPAPGINVMLDISFTLG